MVSLLLGVSLNTLCCVAVLDRVPRCKNTTADHIASDVWLEAVFNGTYDFYVKQEGANSISCGELVLGALCLCLRVETQ